MHPAVNIKFELVPNDRGDSENGPDFHVQAVGQNIHAESKKVSRAERLYVFATLDDPLFPATVDVSLIEGGDGTLDLWSRSKPQPAS